MLRIHGYKMEEFQSTQPKRAATIPRVPLKSWQYLFQSTQPKRAATVKFAAKSVEPTISIHAAQEGCDCLLLPRAVIAMDFNPRSPRGLRQKSNVTHITL